MNTFSRREASVMDEDTEEAGPAAAGSDASASQGFFSSPIA